MRAFVGEDIYISGAQGRQLKLLEWEWKVWGPMNSWFLLSRIQSQTESQTEGQIWPFTINWFVPSQCAHAQG